MRKLIAVLALASCSAFADYNPLPQSQADYLIANFVGIWNVASANSGMTVTIDHDSRHLTLMLDDDEILGAKVIDVDSEHGIVTIEAINADGNIGVISLKRDSMGDLWFSTGKNRFPLMFTRRITERDRIRIECITAPIPVRETIDANCKKMGL